MTDMWPQEEGAVFDANSYILPCYPEGTISEMSSVKPGATTTAGRIDVTASTALGDGIGIALKEATGAGVPERIPVLFYGACKVLYSQTGTAVVMGEIVMNSITTTYYSGAATVGNLWADLEAGGGASFIMGIALQACAAGDDEGLILVGKCV